MVGVVYFREKIRKSYLKASDISTMVVFHNTVLHSSSLQREFCFKYTHRWN